MIATVALLWAQASTDVHDYFPLTSGTKWTYSDTASPGVEFVSIARDQQRVASDDPSKPSRIFTPVDLMAHGSVIASPCYFISDDAVLLVGNGPTRPVTPRPILRISGAAIDWQFYSDSLNPLQPDPVVVSAHSELGHTERWFGKDRKTVVVTMSLDLGDPRKGLHVKQISEYAEGIGLVKFSESGVAGGKPIPAHERKLVKFEPKESTAG